jgi:hypothetical protein
MKKLKFILYFLLFFSIHLSAQNLNSVSNSVYLELGGNGLLGTINYEREIISNFNIRLGMSAFPNGGGHSNSESLSDWAFGPLIMVNYLYRISKESSSGYALGTGILLIGAEKVYPSFLFGYRYSPIDGGITFQIAITPIIDLEHQFDLWAGVSIGYRF